MTTDKLLERIRDCIKTHTNDPCARELAALFDRLDTQLTNGGRLPKAWTPGTSNEKKPAFQQRDLRSLRAAVCQAAANLYNASVDVIRIEVRSLHNRQGAVRRIRLRNNSTGEVYMNSNVEGTSMGEHLSRILTVLNAARATKRP